MCERQASVVDYQVVDCGTNTKKCHRVLRSFHTLARSDHISTFRASVLPNIELIVTHFFVLHGSQDTGFRFLCNCREALPLRMLGVDIQLKVNESDEVAWQKR